MSHKFGPCKDPRRNLIVEKGKYILFWGRYSIQNVWMWKSWEMCIEQWGRRAQRGSKMDGKPNKATEENDWGRGRAMEGMCSELWSRKQWNFVTLMHTHSTMLAKFNKKFPLSPSLTLSHTHIHTGVQLPYQSHIPTLCLVWHLQQHSSFSQAIFV